MGLPDSAGIEWVIETSSPRKNGWPLQRRCFSYAKKNPIKQECFGRDLSEYTPS
jgi:hypothetical protein